MNPHKGKFPTHLHFETARKFRYKCSSEMFRCAQEMPANQRAELLALILMGRDYLDTGSAQDFGQWRKYAERLNAGDPEADAGYISGMSRKIPEYLLAGMTLVGWI